MTILVANLGSGKGSWKYLIDLITKETWEKVVLITNAFGAERFAIEGTELNFIIIDDRKELPELIADILAQLKPQLEFGCELGLNMVSATGKEHMALLSALLKLGMGIRLVGLKGDSVEEL